MHIGFLGLGNMGSPMASNLLKAGYQLSVFDLSSNAVAELTEKGAQGCATIDALVAAAPDVLISMLPAAVHVKGVYLGEDGLIAQLTKPTHLIDCSTIDPHSAREVAKAAQDAGHSMVDAPVSGGTAGAQAATLTFMVGGAAEDLQHIQPILQAMGKNITHCGDSGNGQVAKVANNMLLGISMIGVAEAMALGVSLGMDAKTLAGIINTSSGRCWSSPGLPGAAPLTHHSASATASTARIRSNCGSGRRSTSPPRRRLPATSCSVTYCVSTCSTSAPR